MLIYYKPERVKDLNILAQFDLVITTYDVVCLKQSSPGLIPLVSVHE